jgi:hypothetical protein
MLYCEGYLKFFIDGIVIFSRTTGVIEVETSIVVIGRKVMSNSLRAKIVNKIESLGYIIVFSIEKK